jgi:hypothetical protein
LVGTLQKQQKQVLTCSWDIGGEIRRIKKNTGFWGLFRVKKQQNLGLSAARQKGGTLSD